MITSSEVMQEVATIFNLTTDEMKAKNRSDSYTYPRKILIYVCCKQLKMKGAAISRLLKKDVCYGPKMLHSINKSVRTGDMKWLEYWKKYERESSIWKHLTN